MYKSDDIKLVSRKNNNDLLIDSHGNSYTNKYRDNGLPIGN